MGQRRWEGREVWQKGVVPDKGLHRTVLSTLSGTLGVLKDFDGKLGLDSTSPLYRYSEFLSSCRESNHIPKNVSSIKKRSIPLPY